MNDGHRLYLSTYFQINLIDYLIKNAALYYRMWKYWHLPKNMSTALAVCVVYDMYLECAEGNLKGEWYIPEKMQIPFHLFCENLSGGMMKYTPQTGLMAQMPIIHSPSQPIMPAATQHSPLIACPIPTNLIEHMDNRKQNYQKDANCQALAKKQKSRKGVHTTMYNFLQSDRIKALQVTYRESVVNNLIQNVFDRL